MFMNGCLVTNKRKANEVNSKKNSVVHVTPHQKVVCSNPIKVKPLLEKTNKSTSIDLGWLKSKATVMKFVFSYDIKDNGNKAESSIK